MSTKPQRNSSEAKKIHREAIAHFRAGNHGRAAELALSSGQTAHHVSGDDWLRWAATIFD
jgi:hypothetical protein